LVAQRRVGSSDLSLRVCFHATKGSLLTESQLHISPQAVHAFDALQRYIRPPALFVVISGPSGVGKDSVIRRMQEMDSSFRFIVTATDRSPRPGEVHGVDYLFVSTAEFERMIAEDELLEYARVYNQYKGVPKAQACEALSSGQDVIMRVDVQGAETMRRLVPGVLTIFLAPPSLDVLIQRLSRRNADSVEQLQRRLDTAVAEMNVLPDFDYVVVNREDRLDESVRQIVSIIQAEKCRTARRNVTL